MQFPLQLRFKILALGAKVAVHDATGNLVYYFKQKAFKLKEAVTVYADETQTTVRYRIAADRVLDISAKYHIEDSAGRPLAVLERHGMRSLWRAHYEIHRGGVPLFRLQEETPWIKVLDGLVGQIPVVGMLTGYLLHPTYVVTRATDETPVLRVIKQPAFFESRYRVEQVEAALEPELVELALLGALMLLLLERDRG
ncbi:MAG: hypothetical protein H0T44_12540 [Gemmatimonadales bacterium]|nr:hypothetical protein [Gemmatimonadales bacterium]